MDIGSKKKAVRDKIAKIELGQDYRATADEIITQKVLSILPQYGLVLCYVSTKREPSTEKLLQWLSKQGRLALPRCDKQGVISVVPVSDLTTLTEGRYGIPAPPNTANSISARQLSAVVLPCVACDEKGYRIGHGGGYYDRLLADTDCKTICLCYAKLIAKQIPHEPHDIKPHCVVTENEVIWATDTVN